MAETELMRIVTPNATSDLSPRHWFQHSGDKVSPIMIPMQKTARDFLPSDSDENIEMETRSNCGPDCQSECRGFSLEAETTTTLLPESTEGEDSVSMSSFDSDDDTALVREKNDKEDVVCPTVSVCLSVCLYVCRLVYLPACLSVHLFVCLSAYLSVCSSICPSMNLVFLNFNWY